MRISKLICMLPLLLFSLAGWAQGDGVTVDYNNPKKYIVGGVGVEGNHYFSESQILQVTGLQKGMEVEVPGEALSSIVDRMYLQAILRINLRKLINIPI